ncbi:Peptidase propeptide and YPEB domain-containing protein [Halopseudomonas sabulinigri]|uniref:Peptidase propeptide and YPEB domain-containing protein n=2 Tax=Halopseudomonas sabulinigri TaxID=472181 RepID=A0A1H1P7S8_9GAMM|nr:Peptidase propeptide and YPEB domain-containing protein [Halopseudomonas sabulinigri]
MLIWMPAMAKYLNTSRMTDHPPLLRPGILMLGLFACVAGVRADDISQDQVLELVEQGRIAPLQQFIDDALARYPGRFLEAELEFDDGLYIYEIEVITRQRRVMELEYDALTGELLEVEEDD